MGIHLKERYAGRQLRGHVALPLDRHSQRAEVGHHRGHAVLRGKLRKRLSRQPLQQDEWDAQRAQLMLDLP